MEKRIARYALLVSLAMVLSWLESLIVFPGLLPGMKVGLTNLVVVFALYRASLRDAAAVSLVRVALVSLTFGNAYSFAYSLAGAVLSLAVMAGLKKLNRFSILGVSIAGGVCHNLGQLAVAMAVLGTARLWWYLPWLLAGGVLAGAAVGTAAGLTADRINRHPEASVRQGALPLHLIAIIRIPGKSSGVQRAHGRVVVLGGRQPACVLRLALRPLSSPPFLS